MYAKRLHAFGIRKDGGVVWRHTKVSIILRVYAQRKKRNEMPTM